MATKKVSKKKKTVAKKTNKQAAVAPSAPKTHATLKAVATLAFWVAIVTALAGATYKMLG
jgi:hypothetical protein